MFITLRLTVIAYGYLDQAKRNGTPHKQDIRQTANDFEKQAGVEPNTVSIP